MHVAPPLNWVHYVCMWMHWTIEIRNKLYQHFIIVKCAMNTKFVVYLVPFGFLFSGEGVERLHRYPRWSLSADVADLLTWWKARCITLGNENSDHISRVMSSFLKRDEKKRENIRVEDNLWCFDYWCYRSSLVGVFFSRSLVFSRVERKRKQSI